MLRSARFRDEASVVALAQVLRPELAATIARTKHEKAIRSCCALRLTSLGQIGNKASAARTVSCAQDQEEESDVRREAATALGLDGDKSALPR